MPLDAIVLMHNGGDGLGLSSIRAQTPQAAALLKGHIL
jgi:hypothetical protein